MIKSQDLNKCHLPDGPGVYFFKNKGDILYIGKATSIKDRVKSYFSNDLIGTRGPLIVDLLLKANKIDFIETDSVLEALILEANLIKKYQPKYNTKEKDDKSYNYVVITKEKFPRVLIIRGREIEKGLEYKIKDKFGPFTEGASLKIALKTVRKIFPFRDKCEPNSGKPCFNRQIGLCPGVCDGSINKKEYGKLIRKIKLFFSGKTESLKRGLKKEMKALAKEQKFEKANEIKRQIFALSHIQDVALIKDEDFLQSQANYSRFTLPRRLGGSYAMKNLPDFFKNPNNFHIEAYDVAHLSGTNNVGVVVVRQLADGNWDFKKSDYRKFKIRESKGNDIGALKEVLERRLKHTEWPSPDLIVVDGGLAQLNAAKKVIKQNHIQIPVVAVTKNDSHKPKAIIGEENLIKKQKKEILLVNNEAHRFAIAFHRQRRSVIL